MIQIMKKIISHPKKGNETKRSQSENCGEDDEEENDDDSDKVDIISRPKTGNKTNNKKVIQKQKVRQKTASIRK